MKRDNRKLEAIDYQVTLSNEEKIKIISSTHFYSSQMDKEIIRIVKEEKDYEMLKRVVDRLVISSGEFIESVDLSLFVNLIPLVDIKKQNSLWELIFSTILRSNDVEKKKLVYNALVASKDAKLKATAVNYINQDRVFSKNERKSIFGDQEEILIHTVSTGSTDEVISSTIQVLLEVKDSHPESYEILIWPFTAFVDGGFTFETMRLFFERLLSLWPFPENNRLLTLFFGFSKVEEVLMTSISDHRDHISHSFRVFLIGLQILTVKWENSLKRGVRWGELLCWTLTAFFHDVGYGLQKITEISDKIQASYSALGSVESASFVLSESSRMFAERVISLFYELLKRQESTNYDYEFSMLQPLLVSWDHRDHGIMSAIMFLKELDNMVNADYSFYESYSDKWNLIFIRAGLAMTIHTLPLNLAHSLNIDQFITRLGVSYPFFPSFLLCLIDSLEFIDRPKFKSLHSPDEPLERDIEMSLSMDCYFTIYRNYHLKITLDYLKEVDLLKVSKNIREKLSCFFSTEWGITITIKNPNGEYITLYLLRKEEEEWLKFAPKVLSGDNILDIYRNFLKKKSIQHSSLERLLKISDFKDINEWVPSEISSQINNLLIYQKYGKGRTQVI